MNRCVCLWLLALVLFATPLRAEQPALDAQTVRCRNGAVVSVNAEASDAGVAILKQGGNAVDSAVATALALAVTHPAAGNIGGGGYMLVMTAQGHAEVFDFREVAPAAATREMFVEPTGRTPHRRVGVPGTVRGLALAHVRYGRLPWRELAQPAVELARTGFALDASTAESLNGLLATSDKAAFAELHRVFGRTDGARWRAGDRLIQPDLARTMQRLADEGADGFYLGAVADLIVAEMRRGGGIITREDLASYRPIARQALRGTYRGYEIISVPPSSSGGTTLIEALNILENFDLDADRYSPA
ncbi:MAG TPA: gamma-glutamyltransferase, partial [Pirellulaceae bacterium]|nr:gamma-glutamyltransferase [Pirellulaceae bacterium]